MGGGGGGGGSGRGMRGQPGRGRIQEQLGERVREGKEQIEGAARQRRISEIRDVVEKTLRTASPQEDDEYFVDHGIHHSDRVANKVDDVIEAFEKSGVIPKAGEGALSNDDRYELKAAAMMHDVGRRLPNEKPHPLKSKEFVEKNENLPLRNGQRQEVANLCAMHTPATTAELYGSGDLRKLRSEKTISDREAAKASILRIADALDAGEHRASVNSEGKTAKQVLDTIAKRFPSQRGELLASHWYGHMSMGTPKLESTETGPLLRIPIKSEGLEQHGSHVAQRVKDLVREFRSTIVDNDYSVRFESDDRIKLKSWLTRYQDVFIDDMEGVKAYIGS